MKIPGNHFTKSLTRQIAVSLIVLSPASIATAQASEMREEGKAKPAPEIYSVNYDIRPLKGKLNHEPVLNSNSPEIVQDGGILLSTLDPANKSHKDAHLNYPIKGRFCIFFHHINKQEDREARKLLSISLLAFNPGARKAALTYNALCSYVSQPDAPVGARLAPVMDDDAGKIYAGQGDRVASDFVTGKAALEEPFVINVPPRSYTLVTDLPIKVYGPVSTLNGRTYYANCQASKPLQFAILASFSRPPGDSVEMWHPEDARTNMISLNEKGSAGGDSHNAYLSALVKMIDEDGLAGPREGDKRPPTLPNSKKAIVYSRVSGVQIGARISASRRLTLQANKALAVAYPISSLEQGTFGTGEIQTAPLIKRYPNCAYAAHGNYCVYYQVDLKLVNNSKKSRFVDLALSTPIKSDKPSKSLSYFKEQDRRVFFRGVLKVIEAEVHDKVGDGTVHYYHLVAHRGEKLPPFARFEVESGTNKRVRIELYYTPDATPPQALTIDSEP